MNWYISGGPEIWGTIETTHVFEPIVDPDEGYDPDFRVVTVGDGRRSHRFHNKWIGPTYVRATSDFVEDSLAFEPLVENAMSLSPGTKCWLCGFDVKVIFVNFRADNVAFARYETFSDKLRYYWARGNIWLGYMEVWLVHRLNKVGLASTPEACWPTYGDIRGVERGKYLWRRMTKTVRSWKSAAEDTLSRISSAG